MFATITLSTSFSLVRFLLSRSPLLVPTIVPLPDDFDVPDDLLIGAPLVPPPSPSSLFPSPEGSCLSESLKASSLSEKLLDLTILCLLLESN
jgi:hypothetical protein